MTFLLPDLRSGTATNYGVLTETNQPVKLLSRNPKRWAQPYPTLVGVGLMRFHKEVYGFHQLTFG